MWKHCLKLTVLPIGCLILGSLVALVDQSTAMLGAATANTLLFVIYYIGLTFIAFYNQPFNAKRWLTVLGLGILLILAFYFHQHYPQDWPNLLPYIISSYLIITWQYSSQRLWQPCQWLFVSTLITAFLWIILVLIAYLLEPITAVSPSQLFDVYTSFALTGLLLGTSLIIARGQLGYLKRFLKILSQFLCLVMAGLIVIILIASIFTSQPRLSPMLLNLIMVIFLASINGCSRHQFKLPFSHRINQAVKIITGFSNIIPLLALYSISLSFSHPQAYLFMIESWLATLYTLVIFLYSIFYSIMLAKPNEFKSSSIHYYLMLVIVVLTLMISIL